MGEGMNIIRIAVDDYKNVGGDKWELLNRLVNDIYAKVCEEYLQDDNSKRTQCMIVSLYAALTADSDEKLMDLMRDILFVVIPVKELYAELTADPELIDVINKIRTMFAGAFIKLYFDIYKRAETEYDTWLAKSMKSATELNSESLEKLINNKDMSFKNYKNVLWFCNHYRPTAENELKPAAKKPKPSLG